MQHEAQVAWRLFIHNWIAIGLMAVTLALGLALTGFSLRSASMLLPLGAVALSAGIAYIYVAARRRDSPVPFVLVSVAQLGLITLLTTPVIYIAASADLPMQDANLAYLDRMLGLDWHAYFNFIYDRPTLIPFVVFGYAMIGWPMFGIPIVLGAARQYRRLQQFTLACVLALRRCCRRSAPTMSTASSWIPRSLIPAAISSSYVICRLCATARCGCSIS